MYQQIVNKINSISKFGVLPSLERIRNILNLVGNPQDDLKFVHVAGTNGKGTTSSYIASCLSQTGYKTGLFTSPYVETFSERFRINDDMISENDLVRWYNFLINIKDIDTLTQFEFITVLAFLWFKEQQCDVVVLEVGLGGKFDATNVIKNPIVEVIMSISLDHTAVLGDNVGQIAHEKAGIIKQNSNVVLYPLQEKDVFDVVKTTCLENCSKLHIPHIDFTIVNEDLKGSTFEFDGQIYEIPFSGKHQILNAITALTALKIVNENGFSLTQKDIINGLKKTKIIARAELMSENPPVILDGGHNQGCSLVLADLLKKNASDKKITAIIGMMADKNCEEYVKNLAPLFEKIITVTPDNPRAINSVELAKIANKYCDNVYASNNIYDALNVAKGFEMLVVCGSLFLAGEIRSLLQENLF